MKQSLLTCNYDIIKLDLSKQILRKVDFSVRSKIDNNQEELRSYTSSEAAKKLGLSEQTINRMCEKGRFTGAKRSDDINGEWVIPQENFITTNEQDDVAEMVLQKIDNKNKKAGDIDEFNV